MSPIQARVAQILTERELVLNKGADAGVEIGMRFKILRPKGEDIRDPDTGKILGSVELVKTIVKVTEVQASLALAQTFRTVETQSYGLGSVLGSVTIWGQAAGSRVETLRTSERRIQQDLDEADSFVKIGDPATQVVSEIPSTVGTPAPVKGTRAS